MNRQACEVSVSCLLCADHDLRPEQPKYPFIKIEQNRPSGTVKQNKTDDIRGWEQDVRLPQRSEEIHHRSRRKPWQTRTGIC